MNVHILCGIDMEWVQIWERIFFIEGENKGRYPYSNSVLIDDDVKALIDTGIGRDLATKIAKEKRVDCIINSHGHEDHIAGNCIFKDAKVCSHKFDAPAIRSVENLAQLYAPKGTDAERLVNLFLREQPVCMVRFCSSDPTKGKAFIGSPLTKRKHWEVRM